MNINDAKVSLINLHLNPSFFHDEDVVKEAAYLFTLLENEFVDEISDETFYKLPYKQISIEVFNSNLLDIQSNTLEGFTNTVKEKIEDEYKSECKNIDHLLKCYEKFIEHISLAFTQKQFIQRVAANAKTKAEQAEEIAQKASNLSGRVNETLQHAKQSAKRAEDVASRAQSLANEANDKMIETRKASEAMMVNYVTILGIFATIIITVFGGINIIGSTVKLLEGNSKLAYLVFVVSFLMICLLVLIRTLTSWISSLNNFKEDKVIVSSPKSFFKKSIFWFIVIVVLSGLVVIFNQVNKPEPKEETANPHNKSNVVLMKAENLNQ